ncbi:MAG: DUF2490 domain-containing protein [Saprospiraceae bacterium]|nr:DUF2490 domain-containing protein [Saprospiraceae bacterium]
MLRFYSIIIGLFFATTALGQSGGKQPENSTESRISTQIQLRLNKRWRFTLEEQLRLRFSTPIYERSFTELKVAYLLKKIRFGFAYRFIIQNDVDGLLQSIKQRHRWHGYMAYKFKIKRLSTSFRLQYQFRKQFIPRTHISFGPARHYFRFKTALEYNIKDWKLDPKIGIELFVRPLFNYPNNQAHRYRISIGTDYKIKKRHHLEFRYQFESEFRGWNPKTLHIINLQYRYILKLATRKNSPKK